MYPQNYELRITNYELFGQYSRYFSRYTYAMHPISLSISKCFCTGASVFAAIIPLAATAGRPMPGNVESPQHSSPGSGVPGPGKTPTPALIAGPYEPRWRRRKRSCFNGVPTSVTTHRERMSGMIRSRACHMTSDRTCFCWAYS